MKQLVFLVIISLAAAAWGQDKPAAKEPAKEAAKEPAKEAAKPKPEKQAASGPPRIPNPRRWNEDARHCLERPTNTEVIKCAEEYL
jgi:hypothetical protein